MFSNNKQNHKSYIYEIRLPERLVADIKNFAEKYKENFEVCVQRTLAIGLRARQENKEKYKEALGKALDETEKELRGAL